MYRRMSRAQREAAFLLAATQMYQTMEEWYDQHPDASFGEIEDKARQLRRELMGEGLAILINGRDTGHQMESPTCESCGQPMEYKGHRPWGISGLEGETALTRAYYVCLVCEKETLFPPGPEITTSE